jgi:hypothetical protein
MGCFHFMVMELHGPPRSETSMAIEVRVRFGVGLIT